MKDAMMEWRSVVVLAVRIISSTYSNKYAREEPFLRTNNEGSLLEAEKPMEVMKVVKR